MFIALRDLTFAKGRFLLMATVVALVAFLLTILSGLSTGLIRNNISALMALDISHIAFEYNDKPSYRNSMVDREMWEGWREHPSVIDTQPLGHTMFNARTKDDLPLNEVVLWGIEPGSFLEPAVNRGEQLGRLENGVVIASKLVEKGIDIGEFTAPLDELFMQANKSVPTFAIGDGGNEIGMGNFKEFIKKALHVSPCVIECDYPIIASVSNWGAYGFIAYMQFFTRKKLLPTIEEVEEYMEHILGFGCIDGITGKNEMSVDGKEWHTEEEILFELNRATSVK